MITVDGTGRLPSGWLGPYGHQDDAPRSRATLVGNVGTAERGHVDSRGLVSVRPGWSLDWWIGAEDRWYVPARESKVRQCLLSDSPVVETSMGIPGGDVVHRVFAMRSTADDGGYRLVVVEVENRSPVPVALAFGIRPYDGFGHGRIREIALDGSDVVIDGRVGVVFDRLPARVAGGSGASGDTAATVFDGEAVDEVDWPVVCDRSLANAAFVFALPHTAVIRVVLPMANSGPRSPAGMNFPQAMPTAVSVAKGWEAHGGRGLRIEIPDARLSAAFDAATRSLLLAPSASGFASDVGLDSWPDRAIALDALGTAGYDGETVDVLMAIHRHLGDRGELEPAGSYPAANGAALLAIGHHLRRTREVGLAHGLSEVVAALAQGIHTRRSSRSTRHPSGLLAPGNRRDDARDIEFAAQFWTVAGLAEAAWVFDLIGEVQAAATAQAELDDMTAHLLSRLPSDAPLPAVVGGPADARVAESLIPATFLPVRLAAPWVVATRRHLAQLASHGAGAVPGVDGSADARATLGLALADLAGRDIDAIERLDAALALASPTTSWSDPDSGAPVDLGATARFVLAVRGLLLRTSPTAVELCPLYPLRWLGRGVEVHDAPINGGALSFAIRWHGDRPAVLWQVEMVDGVSPPEISAPVLDPDWRTTESRGEALLEPIPVEEPRPLVGRGRPRGGDHHGDEAPGVGEGGSFT